MFAIIKLYYYKSIHIYLNATHTPRDGRYVYNILYYTFKFSTPKFNLKLNSLPRPCSFDRVSSVSPYKSFFVNGVNEVCKKLLKYASKSGQFLFTTLESKRFDEFDHDRWL